jgi:hypothetical protein
MTDRELADYRYLLVPYLKRSPEDAPRYQEMRLWLAEVEAERQVRKMLDRIGSQAAGNSRPPARAGLDTARAGPQ